MKKTIHLDSSKYTIEYNPKEQWNYRVKRFDEDVTKVLRSNVLNDLVFCLTENIEAGVKLKGVTVTE